MLLLSSFYRFKDFATQAAARAAGFAPKPWIPTDQIKLWADPDAQPSFVIFDGTPGGNEITVYPQAFYGFKNGVADLRQLAIPTKQAREYNIPITGEPGENTQIIQGLDNPTIPVPLNPIPAGYQIMPAHMPGVGEQAQVWAPEDFQSQGATFTVADRALISATRLDVAAIRAKLGA